jgi:hypothetical protein
MSVNKFLYLKLLILGSNKVESDEYTNAKKSANAFIVSEKIRAQHVVFVSNDRYSWVKITKVANYKFGFMVKKLGSYDYEN